MAVDERIKSVHNSETENCPNIKGDHNAALPKVLEVSTDVLISKEHKLHSRPPEAAKESIKEKSNLDTSSRISSDGGQSLPNGIASIKNQQLNTIVSSNQSVNNRESDTSNSDSLSLNIGLTENKSTTFYIGDDSTQSPEEFFEKEKTFNFKKLPRRVTICDLPIRETKKKEDVSPPTFTPPDGGYGWIIAFSAFFINTFIVGFLKSYGVLYISIKQKFPEASAYQISWLPVFLGTFGLVIAPITGSMCRRYTSRKVTFCGGILIFFGILAGAYATTISELIFTYGLLTGVGYGLTSTPGLLIVSLYFEKRRSLACAICVSGNALGSFLFPPLLEYLIRHYNFEGTMIIVAALQLNICALSLLFRPIRVHAQIQERHRRTINAENRVQDPLLQRERNYFFDGDHSVDQILPNSKSYFSRFQISGRKRMFSDSSDIELDELHRQVSFIRSSSMLNSIPNMSQYARSWSVNNNPLSPLSQRSATKLSLKDSKASLSNIASMDMVKGSVKWISATDRLRTAHKASSTTSMPGLVGVTPLSTNRMSCKRNREPPQMTPLAESDSGLSSNSDKIELDEEEEGMNASNTMKLMEEHESLPKTNTDSNAVPDTKADRENTKSHFCCSGFSDLFDFSLLKNPTFLVVNASMFLYMIGTPHALFYLPIYATTIGIEKSRVVSLLSISSIVDLVGRLSIGFLADLNIISCNSIYIISTFVGAASVILIPYCSSYTELAVMLGVYGFGVGSWFVMIPTVLIDNHGPSMLASSYGLVRMFHGLMNFMSPQIMGIILDMTGSYAILYYLMGICMMIASSIILIQSITSCIVESQEMKKYIHNEDINTKNRTWSNSSMPEMC